MFKRLSVLHLLRIVECRYRITAVFR